ncbi:MAG TPA: biopolymer transporter ExbD [Acidobacteriaceae bacterium]|nr:biopolymer transporter ExbD [Terriglobia bacterium]HVC90565.1 biopolymer transporter ExbD [Acidobacteriaceae bacterium]
MAMSGGNVGGLSSTPNVTPLIDVLLVLLIIFMVITPTTPHGLDALVPQPPKNPQHQEQSDTTIVLQVLGSGNRNVQYKINETPVQHSQLLAQLEQIYAIRATKVMFIKGDPNLDWAAIADVVDIGSQAGVDHIGVITPKIAAGQ